MIGKAYFEEKPSEILYAPRTDGTADVWLRKNIEATENGFTADEVHIITGLSKEAVEADFDALFSAAEIGYKTAEERIYALENENAELREQLAATMAAVDFILFGEG